MSCKLCAFPHVAFLNHLIDQGKNAAECNRWATDEFGFSFNRQTFYAHKNHYKDAAPQTALVAAPKGPLQASDIKRSSNREFLETIRDIGLAKANLNPDDVTIDHSLKAASILEQSRTKQQDLTIVFAQVVTGHQPDVTIEGTAREVSPE